MTVEVSAKRRCRKLGASPLPHTLSEPFTMGPCTVTLRLGNAHLVCGHPKSNARFIDPKRFGRPSAKTDGPCTTPTTTVYTVITGAWLTTLDLNQERTGNCGGDVPDLLHSNVAKLDADVSSNNPKKALDELKLEVRCAAEVWPRGVATSTIV